MIGNPSMKCPRNSQNIECSGQGRCSNINTCVCFSGFMGRACDMPSESYTFQTDMPKVYTPGPDEPESGTVSHTHILKESDSDTIIMVIVLVAGVGGVFILFALMALCYRRKSALSKYDPPYAKRQMLK